MGCQVFGGLILVMNSIQIGRSFNFTWRDITRGLSPSGGPPNTPMVYTAQSQSHHLGKYLQS